MPKLPRDSVIEESDRALRKASQNDCVKAIPTPSSKLFTGWRCASFYPEDAYYQKLRKACTKAINWDALCVKPQKLHEMPCSPPIDYGSLSLGPPAAI